MGESHCQPTPAMSPRGGVLTRPETARHTPRLPSSHHPPSDSRRCVPDSRCSRSPRLARSVSPAAPASSPRRRALRPRPRATTAAATPGRQCEARGHRALDPGAEDRHAGHERLAAVRRGRAVQRHQPRRVGADEGQVAGHLDPRRRRDDGEQGGGRHRDQAHVHDYQLHIEWRIPVGITGSGQARGNSGVFLASTGPGDMGYELQVLDSYNNTTYVNGQAASIYKQSTAARQRDAAARASGRCTTSSGPRRASTPTAS